MVDILKDMPSDIPENERKYFEKYYMMCSKVIAISNLDKKEVQELKETFNTIAQLIEDKKYDEAREKMAESIMKLQLRRSISGFGIQVDDNMRKFRGKKVDGWKIVEHQYKSSFEKEINELMDRYDFIDCQYAVRAGVYTALVLLAEKAKVIL